jgi:hypothetical protein
VTREQPRPGYPWGRIADKVQSCADCGTELMRGAWAVEWMPGEPVLETGAGMRTHVLSPRPRATTPKCTDEKEPGYASEPGFHAIVLGMDDSATPRYRLRVALQQAAAERVTVSAADLVDVLNQLDHAQPLGPQHVGRSPYGWRSTHGRLVQIPAEQAALRIVVALREEGHSWRAIVAQITPQQIFTRGGRKWTSSGIRLAFNNAQKYWAENPQGGDEPQNNGDIPVTSETEVQRVSAAS